MTYDSACHARRSIHLRDYDYRRIGAYFVTMCTAGRRPLFGEVVRGRMRLSPCGREAAACWRAIPEHRPHTTLDAFVVMPDHVHGLVVIRCDVRCSSHGRAGDGGGGTTCRALTSWEAEGAPGAGMGRAGSDGAGPCDDESGRAFGQPRAGSLSVIIGSYKAAVTRRCRRRHRPDFGWQRNFYEHIVRHRGALQRIRRYIAENPARWHGGRSRSPEES